MGRRCLVTGGAGVIGQCLVDILVANRDQVRVIDRLARPDDMPLEVDFLQGDIVHLGPDAISSFDPHVVFHLAAAFERSVENPEFWRENSHDNVLASSIVLDGAISSPSLSRYVFASSYLIYDPDLYLSPEPPSVPHCLTETSSIDPRNVCGAAKLLHEKEIELASHVESISFTSVSARIYRVYGRSSRDIVSRSVRSALAEEQITVFGEESMFDYVFADDVAEGLFRLADSSAEGVVNLASGRSRTVRELVECLRSHFPDLSIDGPYPAESYEASQADLSRLAAVTGWQPASTLEFGVSALVAHERANLAAGRVSRRVREPIGMNVLISSLSRKASLVRAVRDAFDALNLDGVVWGADTSPEAPARSLVDRFWHTPRLDHMSDSDLVGFCVDNSIDVLVPTRDGELLRFADLADRLRTAGVFVPIGSRESVEVADDKLLFAQRMVEAGLRPVPTALTTGDLDAERWVVKPRSGAGSRGMVLDVSRRESEDHLELPGMVVQPFVEGDEYSVDLYVRQDGSVMGAAARRRVRIENGESVVTTTETADDIVASSVACALALGIRGHAVVQSIVGNDGPLLLECNSRLGGASAASFAAGLRSIDAMMLEARGERPGDSVIRAHVTMTRLTADRFGWE